MILRRTKDSLLIVRRWLNQWLAKPRCRLAIAAIALCLSCGCGEDPYQPTESPADFYFAAPTPDRYELAPAAKGENRVRDVASISTTNPIATSPYWEFPTPQEGPLLRRLPIVVTDPYAPPAVDSPRRSTVFDPIPEHNDLLLAQPEENDLQSLPESEATETVDSTVAVMLLPPMPTEETQPTEAAPVENPLSSTTPSVEKGLVGTPRQHEPPIVAEEQWQNGPFATLPNEPIADEATTEDWRIPSLGDSDREEFFAKGKSPSEAAFVGTQAQQEASFGQSSQAPPLPSLDNLDQQLAEFAEPGILPTPAAEDDALAGADPLPPAIATGELTGAKVNEQAIAKLRRGYQLASRGAYYAARAEFIGVLRMISQAKDAKHGRPRRTIALAAGLRALEEAADFAPHGNALDAELDVAEIATSHRTRLDDASISDDPTSSDLLPQQMMERYLRYAQLKLGGSVAGEPVGSMALHALGKLHSQLGRLEPEKHGLAHRIAYAYQQAALMAHNENHLAAHELGVLMAESGHYPEAKDLLSQVAQRQPHPTVLRNLARVEKELGETTLSAATRDRARALEQQTGETQGVAWLSPNAFAAAGIRDVPLTNQPQHTAGRPAPRVPTPQPQGWRR